MMIALLLAAATPIALPADLNQLVEVDGRTYRVRVKGRTVRVFQKTFIWTPSPEHMARMVEATRRATGCDLRNPYFERMYLTGLLDCQPARSE